MREGFLSCPAWRRRRRIAPVSEGSHWDLAARLRHNSTRPGRLCRLPDGTQRPVDGRGTHGKQLRRIAALRRRYPWRSSAGNMTGSGARSRLPQTRSECTTRSVPFEPRHRTKGVYADLSASSVRQAH
jgi:hypothetical protein